MASAESSVRMPCKLCMWYRGFVHLGRDFFIPSIHVACVQGVVIEACVRTKRLEEAIGFIHQIRIVRPSQRSVSLTKELVKLCYSENNVEAARVCQDVLGQLYSQNGGGRNEQNSQYNLWGRILGIDAWLAGR